MPSGSFEDAKGAEVAVAEQAQETVEQPDVYVPIEGELLEPGLATRIVTLIAVVVPPLGLIVGIAQLWGNQVHPVDLALLVLLYVIPGLGITIGFHRYFTHRGFETSSPMRVTLAILGSMTCQGMVRQWVSDHRKHHAHSDQQGDPHSPHVGHGAGVLGALRGFWHSHVGWLFSTKGLVVRTKYGRDLLEDTVLRRVDSWYLAWVALGFVIPAAIGYLVGGPRLAAEAAVWGGLIRIVLFQHVTWSVNSVCHMFGRRSYSARDESRNNWLLALPSLGEAWHNNHHAFPSSAVHGLDRFQLDVSGWLIRLMEKVGLVWDVRVPDEPALERRRMAAQGG
jgi:stearoyl-CoA desaturase (delta-9 desaturase)